MRLDHDVVYVVRLTSRILNSLDTIQPASRIGVECGQCVINRLLERGFLQYAAMFVVRTGAGSRRRQLIRNARNKSLVALRYRFSAGEMDAAAMF